MAVTLPTGEYAIVQLLGHIMLVGRIKEIVRLGTTMLSIEMVFRDELLPPTLFLPRCVDSLTVCTPEQAIEWQAPSLGMIPEPLQLVMQEALYTLARAERDALHRANQDEPAAPSREFRAMAEEAF